MITNNHQDITIIIRSARERTESLCYKLITEQGIPENQVFIVREVPFSKAMKRSFEIGIEENRKWTYCIDADVLLRTNSIKIMTEFAEKEDSNVCEIQGFVMDKFFGGPRQAGNHLYRTSLLDKVIERIPDEGTDIRPERYTLNEMRKSGYPWKKAFYIVGIHDYEQYHFDIYRKSFVHGKKHTKQSGLFIDLWRERRVNDFDFVVALRGFADSLVNEKEAFINKSQPLYRTLYDLTGFQEKSKLNLTKFSLNQIDNVISTWVYPAVYYSYFPTRGGLDLEPVSTWVKIKQKSENMGLVKTILTIVGSIFTRIGKKIRFD